MYIPLTLKSLVLLLLLFVTFKIPFYLNNFPESCSPKAAFFTPVLFIHPTPPEGYFRLTKQGANMLEDLTSLATRAGIKHEILCCENIIVLGINQNETEAKLGADLPTLDLETQAQLSHALLMAYMKLNEDSTPLERFRSLMQDLKTVLHQELSLLTPFYDPTNQVLH